MTHDSTNVDLQALAIIEAWHNPRFKEELARDARSALEKLAARDGLDPSIVAEYVPGHGHRRLPFDLPPSPVGPAPAELRRILARKETEFADQVTAKIELSPEQREAIRQATGKEVAWLELASEALEGPAVPSAVRARIGAPSTWDC